MTDYIAKILPYAQDLESVARFVAVVYAPAGIAASLINDGIVAAQAYEAAKNTVHEVMTGQATAETMANVKAIAKAVPADHPVFVMRGRSAVSNLESPA